MRRRWPTSPSGTAGSGRPVALGLEAVRGGAVPRGRRTHRDASPRILHLQKRGRGRPLSRPPARLAGCESSLSARGVSLRLEINLGLPLFTPPSEHATASQHTSALITTKEGRDGALLPLPSGNAMSLKGHCITSPSPTNPQPARRKCQPSRQRPL